MPIYQDALAPGWQNWSWGSTEDFSDISQVFAGTKSIKVTYTSAWGGMFLHNDTPINTTGKTSLTFAVAGSGASGQSLQVFMFDSAGTKLAVVNIAPYMTGGITAGLRSNGAPTLKRYAGIQVMPHPSDPLDSSVATESRARRALATTYGYF